MKRKSLNYHYFNDILLRKYLNINSYLYSPICLTRFFKKRRLNYFIENDQTIIVGFIINTIDGVIEYPVVDMNNIRLKRDIFVEIKEKIRKRLYKLLYDNTTLPNSLLELILSFY